MDKVYLTTPPPATRVIPPAGQIWYAVVKQAVLDRLNGNDEHRSSADHFIFHDRAFSVACEAGGLCADTVRARVRKLESALRETGTRLEQCSDKTETMLLQFAFGQIGRLNPECGSAFAALLCLGYSVFSGLLECGAIL